MYPLSDHIDSIFNILILFFLILIRPHYNHSSYCVFPDAEKRLKNHGANDFGEKEEESLFIKYLSGVSLFYLFTQMNDSLLHNSKCTSASFANLISCKLFSNYL